jgi:hypothetical protein
MSRVWQYAFGSSAIAQDPGDRAVIVRADLVDRLSAAAKAAGVDAEEYVKQAIEDRLARTAGRRRRKRPRPGRSRDGGVSIGALGTLSGDRPCGS